MCVHVQIHVRACVWMRACTCACTSSHVCLSCGVVARAASLHIDNEPPLKISLAKCVSIIYDNANTAVVTSNIINERTKDPHPSV